MARATTIWPLAPRAVLLMATVGIASCGMIYAAAEEGKARRAAYETFLESQAAYQKQTNNVTVAWLFARDCFGFAEHATNSAERALIAERGIEAARQAVVCDRKSGPAHYYLGPNLAQLARTRGLGALKIVDQMEREWIRARELEERFDYAGADRHLGLLYREAPSIISVGSRTKARYHFKRAIQIAPDYPDNRLNLIETYLAWHDRNGALREWKALQASVAESRAAFSGPEWLRFWRDWNSRMEKIAVRIGRPPQVLESPRGKN